jgi:RNase P/RNase MRP subunit p30
MPDVQVAFSASAAALVGALIGGWAAVRMAARSSSMPSPTDWQRLTRERREKAYLDLLQALLVLEEDDPRQAREAARREVQQAMLSVELFGSQVARETARSARQADEEEERARSLENLRDVIRRDLGVQEVP